MSNPVNCQEEEYNRLIKILDFRLSPIFKKLGYWGAFLLLTFLMLYKFAGASPLPGLTKDLIRTFILFCLLIASLSKDRLEDEFNAHVRFQSYVLAFVCAVGYAILLPLISTAMEYFITQITGDGIPSFHDVSSFEVMFMLMGFQLLFFETLKRLGRA